MLQGSVCIERGKERSREETEVCLPARAGCMGDSMVVIANTVTKHDLVHMWQKVSLEVQKSERRGREVVREREGRRERERGERSRYKCLGSCT